MSRLSDLKDMYGLLLGLAESMGGFRTLDELSRFKDWPERGVYFFFDVDEPRSESGTGPRLVRVGTHALKFGSKSTLRQRLSQHRGNIKGGGNHRGSIFRLLVGQAMQASGKLPACDSWGVKGDKGSASRHLGINRQDIDTMEAPIESATSEYMTRLHFVWLDVPDASSPESLRGVVERNSIALLSNYNRSPLDCESNSWLGKQSNRPLVRESSLWNQNHTAESHDPAYLHILEELVQNQV